MSKVLSAAEIAEVVKKIAERSHAPSDANFMQFLHGVSQAVAGYLRLVAGRPDLIGEDNGPEALYVAFRATIHTPMTNNPMADYDLDQPFSDWLADIGGI